MNALLSLRLLAPLGLLAAISLPLIILIYMRRQQPIPRAIPSLRFWNPALGQERDRSRLRRPPLSLLLLLELLIAALLTFALTQPAAEKALGAFGARSTPLHQIVLLDGSTSMLATDGTSNQTRFDLGRAKAQKIVDSWHPGDVITIVVFGSTTRTLSVSDAQQQRDVARQLSSMPTPGGLGGLNAVLDLARNLRLPDRDNRITLITDGGLSADPTVVGQVGMPITLDEVGTPLDNLAVTQISAQAVSGQNDTYQVTAGITNYSADAVAVPYTVLADGVDVADQQVTVQPGQTQPVTLRLPAGTSQALISTRRLDGLLEDNRATIILHQDARLSLAILLVTDNPDKLQRALAVLPGARVDTVPSATAGIKQMAAGYDLVVYDGITPSSADLPAVPMIFVQPQPVANLFAVTGAMPQPQITRVHAGDPLLADLDVEGLTFGQTSAYQLPAGATEIIGGTSGNVTGPLLWRGTVNGQPSFTIAFSIADSNIGQRVVFPVLVARMVDELVQSPLPSAVSIGEPIVLHPPASAAEVRISSPSGRNTTISTSGENQGDAVTFAGTSEVGIYSLTETRGNGEALARGQFAVNAGNPVESNLQPNAQLPALLRTSGASATQHSSGTTSGLVGYWPLIAAIALGLLAVEWIVAVARLPRWSRVAPERAEGGSP